MYQKLKIEAGDSKNIDRSLGMLEQAKMFGFGKIWIACSDGDWKVSGEFTATEVLWEYKQMMDVYKQLMKDYPQAKEFYNLYLNDPSEVSVQKQKTWILFR